MKTEYRLDIWRDCIYNQNNTCYFNAIFCSMNCIKFFSNDSKEIKVITLCGSVKFKKEFRRIEKELNFKGNLVIALNNYGHIEDSNPFKEILSKIHFKRINISDAIFVINKDGYIGNSTRKEIEYATEKGKEIIYME